MAIMQNSLSPGSDGTGGAILPTHSLRNVSELRSLPDVIRQPVHVDIVDAPMSTLTPFTVMIVPSNSVLVFSTFALHSGAEYREPFRSLHPYWI